jgi:zinc transport system substrate-binding protein
MPLHFFNVRAAWMVLFVLGLTGFGGSASAQETRTRVVTTLFPLYDFARNIGQDKIDLSMLLPPGVEPLCLRA